jgi:hypothetical protein
MIDESQFQTTSNTQECFRICVGRKVVGVMFDALPIGRMDLRAGNKTLIFEDGEGLTISSRGTFWTETKRDIFVAVREREAELASVTNEHTEVLRLTGLAENAAG